MDWDILISYLSYLETARLPQVYLQNGKRFLSCELRLLVFTAHSANLGHSIFINIADD